MYVYLSIYVYPSIYFCIYPLQLGQLIMYYTPKKVLPFAFFNLPGLQKQGRNHFPKNSCWGIKDQGILNSQNKLLTNSLTVVQGDCEYFFFFYLVIVLKNLVTCFVSFGKLFCKRVFILLLKHITIWKSITNFYFVGFKHLKRNKFIK